MESKNKISRFQDLMSWKKGHELTLLIYKLTSSFPDEERFGLVSQIRRSSISITSNIAEGFGRGGFSDKVRFYDMAIGSLYEVQSQLCVAKDIGYLNEKDFNKCFDLTEDTVKLLIAWMRILH